MHLILHCGCEVIAKAKKNTHKGKQKNTSPNYSIMYYKNSNNIGARRRHGRKEQAFSFGGRKCQLSEEQLREYADQALEKLGSGLSEADVAGMIKAAIASAA